MTTPGAPSQFNSGIRTRQPEAAPIRSAAYSTLMRLAIREKAIDITLPPVKNGSAARP